MADFWDAALDTLGAIAPSIATALGGPIAGMAVTAIEKACGLDPTGDKTAALQAVANATPDQILALKKVDNDFAVQMRQLDIDLVKISASDRDSARKREVDTKDWTPKVLAIGLTVGFFGLLSFLIGHEPPAGSRDVLNIMLGSLGAGWGTMVAYYFGASNDTKKLVIK